MHLRSLEVVAFGNKVDLVRERTRGMEEVKRGFEEVGVRCFETSAVTGEGVMEGVRCLVEGKRGKI